MYHANLLIVVDPRHPDHNSLQDIVDALIYIGADVVDINHHHHIIEAVVALHEVPTVEAMGGVAYVRPIFVYLAMRETIAG